MEYLWRLTGISTYTPKKPAPLANDPQSRLRRFQRVYDELQKLLNQRERPPLELVVSTLERIITLLREESRAPVPHTCIQFAKTSQLYAVIARAARVSQHEPVIRCSISLFGALIDSEDDEFLNTKGFAKSLMTLVTTVVDSGNVLIGVETETAILELLFTVSAKIRLQPEILPVWFHSTAKPEDEDVFVREKKSFVGITAKDDFPLCYLLIDRVHHEGRIGDFARTGLLYIFEATGRSVELEEWVVSSDLPTLMSTGLGALYSQLSRELSIVHFDANLPAVLAMSDYRTTHPRATAESAYSDRHKAHMATFLSYLAFFQDLLDHCRSIEVKATLLDHFQILFSQQLLYPSLLQSSDTDAGSSVAVLTYVGAMLESLEYPDLINNMLTYLLAIRENDLAMTSSTNTLDQPPRSPTTLRRRQSLMLLNAPRDPESAVDPDLFNLVDLIVNNLNSKNSQSVFAALRLTSTIISRQKKFALGTLLKIHRVGSAQPGRTVGALNVELDHYAELASSLHRQLDLEDTYASLCADVRNIVEAQLPSYQSASGSTDTEPFQINAFLLSVDDPLMRLMVGLLRTFFTNSVEVNLALTQTIIAIALCPDIRLEGWALVDPQTYQFQDLVSLSKPWQKHLDSEEHSAWSTLQETSRRPVWQEANAPMLHTVIASLASELQSVRATVPNLEQLIAGRKIMLQAYNLEGPLSEPTSILSSPTQGSFPNVPKNVKSHSRNSSVASTGRSRMKAASPMSVAFPEPSNTGNDINAAPLSSSAPSNSIFKPPPPETPSTTDILMQPIPFPSGRAPTARGTDTEDPADHEDRTHVDDSRTASLNHVLTNAVVLQEFALELLAVIQVRAAVFGEWEVRTT